MNEFVLYGVNGSPFVRAVQIGLEEKRLPYRIEPMGPGDSKTETHLKRHPFGRVPAVQHDDFVLYETQAILRYLDDLQPEPPFQPEDRRQRARMNQIIGINDWYLFPKAAAPIVFNRIVGPVLLKAPGDEAAIQAAVPMAKTCIVELDRLLGDQPFLAGDRLSIADIMLAPQLDFLAATPEGKAAIEPTRLKGWLARMNARPSMMATTRPEALRGAA
jgi:glutathione S-transferase